MIVLEVKNLVKVYGGDIGVSAVKALNGINLQVRRNEFVGIMGPSGSGKTTLLNVLSGLLKPSSGTVLVENTSLHSMNPDESARFRRTRLGFIFQDFNLMDGLTLGENILLPLIMDKRPLPEMEQRLEEIVSLLELADVQHKCPSQVSGGQQQRACIGRALISQPAIIFADEPTGNLDSTASKNIMEYLHRLNQEQKSTILMVTHDPNSASFCSRVIFIRDGAVHSELYRKKNRKEFLEQILDSISVLGGVQNDTV